MDVLKSPRLEWRFGLWWVVGTTLGWIVGFTLCEALKPAILSITSAILSMECDFTPDGALIGTGIGLVQWLVLRRFVRTSGWWFPATMFGFALGKALNDALVRLVPGLLGFVLGGAIIGFLVGLVQMVVPGYKTPKREMWVAASAVGWAAGWTIMNLVNENAGAALTTIYLVGAIGAAVAGLITGFAWIRLSQFNPA